MARAPASFQAAPDPQWFPLSPADLAVLELRTAKGHTLCGACSSWDQERIISRAGLSYCDRFKVWRFIWESPACGAWVSRETGKDSAP